ncbi:MAG: DUF3052 domain-containing protein [Acidimicrobiales bacterium]
MTVTAVGAPDDLREWLAPMPPDVQWVGGGKARLDLAIMFVTRRAEVERRFLPLGRRVAPEGAIWIAWPKKASGLATDVTENALREIILPTGYVDTKVCAINEVWSGLKFVLRKELRPKP